MFLEISFLLLLLFVDLNQVVINGGAKGFLGWEDRLHEGHLGAGLSALLRGLGLVV